jgi:hypothetical protein
MHSHEGGINAHDTIEKPARRSIQTLSNTWVQEASQIALSTAGLQSLFGLLASVIVFMALAWQVPKLASSILQGSLQMGSSDLIAPAMSAGHRDYAATRGG